MKGPLNRTKVVLRHLPPTISRSALIEHVDSRFSGRYHWLSFRNGRSRAYIDFNKPEDVIEFAEFFNGHVFVNEKGTQFKTVVEYAPSQRVPTQWSKQDGREGTIFKDPEYLEFLEFLAKPVENLPSAEIQLERKEAERAGAPKDTPTVTPLMDYVRKKRAAKSGARRMMLNGKPIRRVTGVSSKSPGSGSAKRGSEKRSSTTMYILRDSSKGATSKDKPSYILVPKGDDKQLSNKSINIATASGTDALEDESGGSRFTETEKKKILLLKGKEKEIPTVSCTSALLQNAASYAKNSHGLTVFKQNQQRETSGRIVRSILISRGSSQNKSSSVSQSELQIQNPRQDRDKKPPRPNIVQSFLRDKNGAADGKVVGNDHGIHNEKLERQTRNKDRHDHGVRIPIRLSVGSHASDGSFSSSSSQTSQITDSAEGTRGEMKHDILVARGEEFRSSGRGNHYSVDNVSYRYGGRRGSLHNVKDADGSSLVEGKPLKRGGSSGYGLIEKQVWVQKSSSGS